MEKIDIGIDWTSPVSSDMPAGPDIQYTSEFAELEAASTVTSDQQFGKVLIPAKMPEWRHVFELAVGLSKQTRDLRVLLLLTRALTRIHGLPGLLEGLQAVDLLLRNQWNEVHPQLVIDGVSDPHIRYGVLLDFSNPDGLVADVRQTVAFRSALGAFTVRDLERVVEQGDVDLNGITVTREKLEDMVSDLRQTPESAALGVASQLVELLGRLLANVEERAGSDFTPDLTNLKRPLERISSLLSAKVPAAGDLLPDEVTAFSTNKLSIGFAGALNSRDDVVKAMDAICAYLERYEPTNPVPLLIRRARRLMGKNFLDIVKDISPDGVHQLRFVAGLGDDDSEQP